VVFPLPGSPETTTKRLRSCSLISAFIGPGPAGSRCPAG
jgi:hypothetical protein